MPLLMAVLFFALIPFPCSGTELSAGEEARQMRELVYQLKQRIEVLERQQTNQKNVDTDPDSNKKDEGLKLKESVPKSRETTLEPDKVLLVPEKDDVEFSFGGQILIEAVSNWPGNPAVSEFDLSTVGVPTGSGGGTGSSYSVQGKHDYDLKPPG